MVVPDATVRDPAPVIIVAAVSVPVRSSVAPVLIVVAPDGSAEAMVVPDATVRDPAPVILVAAVSVPVRSRVASELIVVVAGSAEAMVVPDATVRDPSPVIIVAAVSSPVRSSVAPVLIVVVAGSAEAFASTFSLIFHLRFDPPSLFAAFIALVVVRVPSPFTVPERSAPVYSSAARALIVVVPDGSIEAYDCASLS